MASIAARRGAGLSSERRNNPATPGTELGHPLQELVVPHTARQTRGHHGTHRGRHVPSRLEAGLLQRSACSEMGRGLRTAAAEYYRGSAGQARLLLW
jgi:hypothetical protein